MEVHAFPCVVNGLIKTDLGERSAQNSANPNHLRGCLPLLAVTTLQNALCRVASSRRCPEEVVRGSPIGAGVNREKEFRSQLCSSSGSSVPREKCALQCMTRTCHF